MNNLVPYDEARMELNVNKFSRDADQTTMMHRLICAILFTKISAGFLITMIKGSISVYKLSGSFHIQFTFLQPNQCSVLKLSLVVGNPVFGVYDQVRHKPECTAT